mgnify:CR=1 FL=1
MPAINSKFGEQAEAADTNISNVPFLPIKTKHRGPMGTGAPGELDIIDEAIALYRANVLMSSMEIVSDADHLLIYLTLTISGTLHFCRLFCISICATPLNLFLVVDRFGKQR